MAVFQAMEPWSITESIQQTILLDTGVVVGLVWDDTPPHFAWWIMSDGMYWQAICESSSCAKAIAIISNFLE
eukprot:15334055-Ditylum_brightwellii.AAC.1